MTKEQNIEIIRKACIEANPSILDLVFGCELLTPFGNVIFVDTYGKTERKEADTIAYIQNGELFTRDVSEKGFDYFFEIIGRKIGLADVLLAMAHNLVDLGASVSFKNANFVHLFPQGASKKEEYISVAGVSVDTRRANWDLKNDNLEDQSEETLSFIAELLS